MGDMQGVKGILYIIGKKMNNNLKKGICNECQKECDAIGISPPEKLIVNKSKKLCQYHNKTQKSDGNKFKRRTTLKKHFRKATGEAEVFKQIWEALEPEERVSFVTGFALPDQQEMRTYYFSHVLSKGAFPELRLYKKNIVLMTLQEHKIWENEKHKIKANPKLYKLWMPVFELADELKTLNNDNSIPKTN